MIVNTNYLLFESYIDCVNKILDRLKKVRHHSCHLIMQKLIPLKFFTLLLLMVILTVMINGVYESAEAMQNCVATGYQEHSDISASHQCPCAPREQQKDYDGCDTCANCACHAPLIVLPFKLHYNPSSILALQPSDPFTFLPEVYLSKFIPPQKQV